MGYIYKITNDINDKVYIGKTQNTIEQRWKEHCNDRKTRRCEKRPLYNAMNKYGIEHFYIEQIEECPIQELSIKEIYWIGYYDSYINGYNATLGGDGSSYINYNLIWTLWNNSDKTITEIAKELNCCVDTVSNFLHSQNITNTDIKKRMASRSSKGISAYDKNNNLIKHFESRTEAAKWLIETAKSKGQIKHIVSTIGKTASGKETRKTAYGYIWKNE